MNNTQLAPPPPRRWPKPLRVAIVLVSMTLGALFVLFAAAVTIMPSTKSSRIDWQQRQADQAAAEEEAQTTQPVR
jgi:hypothetical protein